jgi:hypothetical protein
VTWFDARQLHSKPLARELFRNEEKAKATPAAEKRLQETDGAERI